jgi:integrase
MDYTEFLNEIKMTKRKSTWEYYQYALANFPEATPEEVCKFIDTYNAADTTKKGYLRVLNIALEYYGLMTKPMKRIIRGFRPDEPIQECPTTEQVELVWKNLPSSRERAMFSLMAYMGLRIGEVIRLNLDDIRKDRVVLQKTKGHRADVLPLVHPRVKQSINEYIHGDRLDTDDTALFTGRRGRLGLGTAKNMFCKEFRDNGLSQFHCHSLRRYFANMMYTHGVSLIDMQDNMRHASADTTRRYLNLTQQNRVAAMEKTWGAMI